MPSPHVGRLSAGVLSPNNRMSSSNLSIEPGVESQVGTQRLPRYNDEVALASGQQFQVLHEIGQQALRTE